MEKIPYLQCIDGRYVFRRRIPGDVRQLFDGKTERIVVLHARDPDDIKKLVDQLARAFDREVYAARKALEASRGRNLRDDEVDVFARRYRAAALATDELERDEGLSDAEYDAVGETLTLGLAQREKANARGQYEDAQDILDAVLHAERLHEPNDPALRKRLLKALLEAEIGVLEQLLERHRGRPVATPGMPDIRGHRLGAGIAGEAGYFDTMYRLWAEKAEPGITAQYEAELALRRLMKVMDADDSAFYERLLDKPPKDANKGRTRLHLFDLSGDDVERLVRVLTDTERVSIETAKKQVGMLSAIVSFTLSSHRSHGKAENPFKRVWDRRLFKRSGRPKSRVSFTAAQLQQLYSSKLYLEGPPADDPTLNAVYWVNLLATFTGARLEELADAECDDVFELEDGLWFSIQAKVRGQSEEQRKAVKGQLRKALMAHDSRTLKNNGSERVVPVHEELIKVGFVDYVRELRARGEVKLFPQLMRDRKGKTSAALSKRANRYLDDIGLTERSLVMHSHRHAFKHFCRLSGVSAEVSDALTGHKDDSVGRAYGSDRFPIEPLREAIKRFRIPGLDLRYLYAHPEAHRLRGRTLWLQKPTTRRTPKPSKLR